MKLFGVINASKDSLHKDSIVSTPEEAIKRAQYLISNGADYIDLGGQGSTEGAALLSPENEWKLVKNLIPELAKLTDKLSIDTWRPEVAKKALELGANIINAADGLYNESMLHLAREYDCPVILPFLSGPDPKHMKIVEGDPLVVLLDWFSQSIEKAAKFKIEKNLILDPGTGFAPAAWPWTERYLYQKYIYQNLNSLKQFHLPIYVALPWKETAQHDELLEIILRQNIDYGRCHHPDRIRTVEARLIKEQSTYKNIEKNI